MCNDNVVSHENTNAMQEDPFQHDFLVKDQIELTGSYFYVS